MGWRRYLVELSLVMVAYGAVLAGSILLMEGMEPGDPWRYPLALAPVLPAAGVIWAVLRQMRRTDEMQNRILMESIAFAFIVTALLAVSYGFLERAGLPKLSMMVVWPVMGTAWFVGAFVARRHYR